MSQSEIIDDCRTASSMLQCNSSLAITASPTKQPPIAITSPTLVNGCSSAFNKSDDSDSSNQQLTIETNKHHHHHRQCRCANSSSHNDSSAFAKRSDNCPSSSSVACCSILLQSSFTLSSSPPPSAVITGRPVFSFREITTHSVKVLWTVPIASVTNTLANNNSNNFKYWLFFDIPGDSERFRLLYYGAKNRVKITGLRRSTVYRLFVRVASYCDPFMKQIGSFGAFSTLPEPRLAGNNNNNNANIDEAKSADNHSLRLLIAANGAPENGITNWHPKGWLAYANPKERDNAVLSVPSFQTAMWCRRYCTVINDSSCSRKTKIDFEYVWQHYRWAAKEHGWPEIKQVRFRSIVNQNLSPQVLFNELDQCNIDLSEFSEDEDYHAEIRAGHKSGRCWKSADCIPCAIGALHLCQSVAPLIYWLACDLCGADFIGRTNTTTNAGEDDDDSSAHLTLADSLTSHHAWIRGHFRDSHPCLFFNHHHHKSQHNCSANNYNCCNSDVNNKNNNNYYISSEEMLACYDHVTGVVIQLFDDDNRTSSSNENVAKIMRKLVRHLRPTDNSYYYSQ